MPTVGCKLITKYLFRHLSYSFQSNKAYGKLVIYVFGHAFIHFKVYMIVIHITILTIKYTVWKTQIEKTRTSEFF